DLSLMLLLVRLSNPQRCIMKRVKTWIFISQGNVLPLTGTSPLRIMLLSRSTLDTWMNLVDTLAHSPLLPFVALSAPRFVSVLYWPGVCFLGYC
ncbi:hypothetical protein QUC31_002565, partial [Theobroma cacao]